MTLHGFIDFGRHARWLTRDRIVAGGWVLGLVQVTFLIMLALWQHGVIAPDVARTSSDFVSFYAAGKLVLAGTPALAYDQAAHFLVEQRFTVEGAPYQFFFYPPVFMLLCAPLALLPYYVAYYVFEIATLAAFLYTLKLILREPGWTWLAPVLAFPAIYWTFGLGQNAFLTAALFGGFTVLIDRRPAMAGLLLGLLCYKPHFGMLAPLALICGGRWRTFLTAAATVALLVALSAACLGEATWLAWWRAFTGSDAVYAAGRIDYAGIVTPFGGARLLGLDASAAYLVQAICAAVVTLVVAFIWRLVANPADRASAMLAATLLAVPLALLYDQLLLLVAMAWLVREGRSTGFLSWEKTGLLMVWLGSIALYPIGSAWHLPLGPLISLAVLTMAMRRAARDLAFRSVPNRSPETETEFAVCKPSYSGMMPPSTL